MTTEYKKLNYLPKQHNIINETTESDQLNDNLNINNLTLLNYYILKLKPQLITKSNKRKLITTGYSSQISILYLMLKLYMVAFG